MKKALALILALAVMLSLAACGQKDTPKADEQTLGTEEVGSAADKYPEKAVKIIIPYGAGGSTDMGGRVVASCLPGFLPGTREELGGGNLRAVNTWFYSGRTPHAPMTNGSLTLKTSNGTDYEVSFSTGDDPPMPYLVTGSFSGTVKKLASN